MTKLRLIVLFLTVWLAVGFALLPAREVRAAIPLIAAAGVFLKTPLGKSFITSAAIHAAVLGIELHDWASGTSVPPDDTTKRLEVKINPKDPMKTPTGWTAPSGGNVEPSPPSSAGSATALTQWRLSTSWPWSNSKQEAGDYWCATSSVQTSIPGAVYSLANSWCYKPSDPSIHTGVSGGWYTQTIYTCPSGYTNTSGTCTLSDATLVQKPADGKTEIKRVANVLYVDARDTADGLPPGTTVTSDTVEFTDSYGDKWTYKINADGTSTSTQSKPRTDGSGKTDVQTTGYSAPNGTTGAVEVTGASSQVFEGTGSLQSATPVSSTNVNFPSDYSRAGEASTAAKSITDALGPKLDKITETGTDPADPLQADNSVFNNAFFNGTFTNLTGWQLPSHTSTCPTSSFVFNGSSFTVNSHCQLIADHFTALQAVMVVVWTVLALFIVLGA